MKPGHGGKMNRLQEAAIAALLTSASIPEAAAIAGVSGNCLDGWLRQPEFQSAYRAARQRLVDGAVVRLLAVVGESISTLQRNLTCGSPSTEVRAALGILEQAFRGHELLDLGQRLAELETLLQGGAS